MFEPRKTQASSPYVSGEKTSDSSCLKFNPAVYRGEEIGPEGLMKYHENGRQNVAYAATNCLASATSTESPFWFSTSSPESGTSPDVLCDP